VTAMLQVLVPCASPQGRGQARLESRPAGDHEAAGLPLMTMLPLGGVN
jgi:hypothetical protein